MLTVPELDQRKYKGLNCFIMNIANDTAQTGSPTGNKKTSWNIAQAASSYCILNLIIMKDIKISFPENNTITVSKTFLSLLITG